MSSKLTGVYFIRWWITLLSICWRIILSDATGSESLFAELKTEGTVGF